MGARSAIVTALVLMTVLASWDATAIQSVKTFNARFYASWSGDLDGNDVDDRLDAAALAGTPGTAQVFVHYEYPPTESDLAVLESAGAWWTYAFRNWDDVQAEIPYSEVRTIGSLPGVVMVELFEWPEAHLEVSARTLRAREISGLPVLDGFDHGLSANEDRGLKGEGMVIAVVDTGVDNSHESLDDMDDDPATNDPKLVQKIDPVTGVVKYAGAATLDSLLVEHPLTGASDNYTVQVALAECIDPPDTLGHGTPVAGIAVGTGGPSGIHRGIAPAAKLVDISVSAVEAIPGKSYSRLLLGVAAALDWALSFNKGETCYGPPGEDRIDVLSMSIGGGAFDDPMETPSRMLTDLARAGITVVVSAGNSGSGARTLGQSADGAIIVANAEVHDTVLRDDDVLRWTSSRGPRNADGDADTIDELRPDVAAPGHNTYSAIEGDPAAYRNFTGTSAAAPHVAGVAALVLQANPGLRPVDRGNYTAMGDAGSVPVRDLLQQTAQPKTATEDEPPQESAWGRFGLPWNNGWGYGLVDAYAATASG